MRAIYQYGSTMPDEALSVLETDRETVFLPSVDEEDAGFWVQ